MAARGYFNISVPSETNGTRFNKKRAKLAPVSAVLAFVLFLIIHGIYSARVCPLLAVGDSGELATAAYTGGVAHAPGYPLFTILGRIFTHLNFIHTHHELSQGGMFDPAFRMNLLAMWLGIAAVMLVYFTLARALKNPFAAFLGAFLFGTASTFLSQCLVGEVYTLHAVITALIIYLLLLIDEKTTSWRMIMLAFAFGLAFSSHTLILLMVAPVLVFLFLTFISKRITLKKSMAWGMLVFFLIGLLPYFYLPVASSKDPYLDYGNPQTFGNFFSVVTRSEYRSIKAGIQKTDESLGFGGLAHAFKVWQGNCFGKWFILLGYIGLAAALIKGRRFGLMLGLSYFFLTVPLFMYFSNITRDDLFFMEVYYIPAHMVFAIFIGYFFYIVLEQIPRLIKPIAPQFIFATIIFVCLAVMVSGFYRSHGFKVSMKDHLIGSVYAHDILEKLPENSILITDGDEVFLFWYLQQVAKYRQDIVVLENQLLTTPGYWLWDSIRRDNPDFIIPDADPEGNVPPPGVFVDTLMALNPERKIYFTAFREDFAPQSSQTAVVQDGILYAYGFKSSFKSPLIFDSPLAMAVLTMNYSFSNKGLDPYEELMLDSYVRAFYNYGNYFLKAGRTQEAKELLFKACEFNPSFSVGNGKYPAAGILALLYLRENDWKNADTVLAGFIKSGNADSLWYYLDSYSLVKMQNFDAARLIIHEAKKKDSNNQFLERMMVYLSKPVNELMESPQQGQDQLPGPADIAPADS